MLGGHGMCFKILHAFTRNIFLTTSSLIGKAPDSYIKGDHEQCVPWAAGMTRMSCRAQQSEWLLVTARHAVRLQKWAEIKSY
jgi:hypothetical protein